MKGSRDDRLPRPFLTPSGALDARWIDVCTCPPDKRRGPEGGVCGACAGAIPTEAEARWLPRFRNLKNV